MVLIKCIMYDNSKKHRKVPHVLCLTLVFSTSFLPANALTDCGSVHVMYTNQYNDFYVLGHAHKKLVKSSDVRFPLPNTNNQNIQI